MIDSQSNYGFKDVAEPSSRPRFLADEDGETPPGQENPPGGENSLDGENPPGGETLPGGENPPDSENPPREAWPVEIPIVNQKKRKQLVNDARELSDTGTSINKDPAKPKKPKEDQATTPQPKKTKENEARTPVTKHRKEICATPGKATQKNILQRRRHQNQ